MRKLTEEEALLVELIHIMCYQTGLSAKEVKLFLEKPITHKDDRNCLECINEEGQEFINELISFLNAYES